MIKRLFVIAAMMLSVGAVAQDKNFIDQNYIEVTGRAEKEVAPDQIFLNINISEKDSRGKSSIEQQEEDLFKRLTSLGVDIQKDLQVSDLSSALQKFVLKKDAILQSRSYTLKVTGTKMLTDVFTELEQAKISDVVVTKASLSNPDQVGREVMAEAATNAKLNAEAIVTVLGRKVGQPIYIQSHTATPRPVSVNTRAGNIVVRGISTLESSNSQPELDFQKIKVEQNVTIRFEIL